MNEKIVYFDESGHTGENLLKEDQPTFSYSTVEITEIYANSLVEKILNKYPKNTQSGELKATTLLKKEKGQEAILEILEELKDKIKVSVSDKKYALSGKFFEYMIEPIIASKSSIFYSLGFHKYIANVIYISFISNDSLAKELLIRFEKLIRSKKEEDLNHLISLLDEEYQADTSKFFNNILLIIKVHKDIIFEEIKDLPKWTADLAISALNALFSELGKDGSQLIAYCDNSKPIFEQKDIFTPMLGRTDVINHPLFTNNNEPIRVTYNLKELHLSDSKNLKGIQLADIVAGATSYSFKMFDTEENDFMIKVRDILLPNIVYGSIFPDFDEINLEKESVQINAILFEEIVERSKKNVNILENIEYTVTSIIESLEINPIIVD